MNGIVKIDDGDVVHVIPRVEVRHVEIVKRGGEDGYALNYQLAGTFVHSIMWQGDCRPSTLKTKVEIGEYNKLAAGAVQTTITRGHRDVHLERRSNGMFLYRLGLIEEDAHVVLCRKFITEMATIALQSALGPIDNRRQQILREIQDAARGLQLPDWYPIKEEDPR